jgi:hypothetical protein
MEIESKHDRYINIVAKVITWGVFGFTTLVIALYFFFQIPVVQSWGIQKITQKLSLLTDSEVKIQNFKVFFLDRLQIKDISISDGSGKEILKGGSVDINLNFNTIQFLREGFSIQKLKFSKLYVTDFIDFDSGESSLKSIIERVFKKDKKGSKGIIVKGIEFDDVSFIQTDGFNQNLYAVKNGFLSIKSLSDVIELDFIELNKPSVLLVHNLSKKHNKASGEIKLPEIIISRISIDDGIFVSKNSKIPSREVPFFAINYQDLQINDIEVDIQNLHYCDGFLDANIRKISGYDKSGFKLTRLSADEFSISNKELILNNLEIITPNSFLKDSLRFDYRNFNDFADFGEAVNMDINFNKSKVFIYDILRFAPILMNNPIFRNNKFRTIEMNGRVSNSVSFLKSDDFELAIQGILTAQVAFDFKHLLQPKIQDASIRVKKLKGNSNKLESLFPGTSFNELVLKIGLFDLSGNFKGSFKNFTTKAFISSGLGYADFNFSMNLLNGKEKAIYQGEINLNDFDIGILSGDRNWKKGDFFLKVINGKGLTLETADVYLEGKAENLLFKDYNYQNTEIVGQLNNSRFNGRLIIKDENIDFDFQGNWIFKDLPLFDFKAQVNRLDFKKLNLIQKDFIFSGLLDFQGSGNSIETIEGNFLAKHIQLTRVGDVTYQLDSILLAAVATNENERIININSDAFTAEIIGNIPITDMGYHFKKILTTGFPELFGQHIPDSIIDQKNSNGFLCGFQLEIFDDKGFSALIDTSFHNLKGLQFDGYLDSQMSILDARIKLPDLGWRNYEFLDIQMNINAKGENSEFDLTVQNIQIGKTIAIPAVTFLGFREPEGLKMAIDVESSDRKKGSSLKLATNIKRTTDELYELSVLPTATRIFNETYVVHKNNKLVFGKAKIKAENFQFESGTKKIGIQTINDTGIKVALEKFDFDILNQILNYPPLKFGGVFNANLGIGNLFDFKDLSFKLLGASLIINGDDWGVIHSDGKAESTKSDIYLFTTISKSSSQVINETLIHPTQNSISSEFNVSSFPLKFAEYFTIGALSQIEGTLNAKFSISGPFDKIDIQGNGELNPGSFTVDFLKTKYSFGKSLVKLDNRLFDITGSRIFDMYGNQSLLRGGISHDRLKNLGFALKLETEKFLGLNTQKGDNNLFYGHALGRGQVTFSGLFQQPNIYVNATVGDSTLLVIPVSNEQETTPLSFINFINANASIDQPLVYRAKQSTGLELEMDLVITDPAVVKIIFDEQAGDILEGSGRGAIRMVVPRNGNFQMFGDYEIERGNYLFTLVNLINKNFNIQRGGSIRWTGDPFEADINLVAAYEDLNTSVANFIQEYLVNASDASKAEASNATNVSLKLLLQGKLLQPRVTFDINFPNLTGEVQSFTDSKLRILKQDPNELNKQVIGLIIAGQFFPTDFSFQGSDFIYNTVSEFFSNQISLLLTQFFSELIAEGDVLSGIDFDIAYYQYQKVNVNESEDFNKGDELKLRLTQNYFNDRLKVLLGGNLEMNNRFRPGASNTGTFLGNDLVIEYSLTKDRSLKIRVYQRLQPDFSGRRVQVGTGLSYRKEFNSFEDFWRAFKKNAKGN